MKLDLLMGEMSSKLKKRLSEDFWGKSLPDQKGAVKLRTSWRKEGKKNYGFILNF